VLLVAGSRTSANSNRLRELADRAGVPGYLIDGPAALRVEWFAGGTTRSDRMRGVDIFHAAARAAARVRSEEPL
jgi:hypothetical protein